VNGTGERRLWLERSTRNGDGISLVNHWLIRPARWTHERKAVTYHQLTEESEPPAWLPIDGYLVIEGYTYIRTTENGENLGVATVAKRYSGTSVRLYHWS